MFPLAFLGNVNFMEVIIILMIGLLLFGSRLPEVGRSLGKGLLEFKKGLRGVQDQMSDLDREVDRRVDEELARRQSLPSTAQTPPAPSIPSPQQSNPIIDVINEATAKAHSSDPKPPHESSSPTG